jgi:hypothetical protein
MRKDATLAITMDGHNSFGSSTNYKNK